MREKILYAVISVLMAAGLLVAAPAFAQTQTQTPAPGSGSGWGRGGMGQHVPGSNGGMIRPGVVGTVASVDGDTLTVTSKAFAMRGATSTSATATTYTVDATNATVMKGGATSTVASIATGDMVMVQGTISGTSVTATRINDGLPQGMGKGGPGQPGQAGAIASLQGNGEPVIGGSISAINGDSLTVTNKSNVTYTVDATNATVVKGNATSSISAIATGDNVIVQGTVNGNAVTASSVIDQGAAQSSGSGNGMPAMHGLGGVFGAIGGFFQHIFGFF